MDLNFMPIFKGKNLISKKIRGIVYKGIKNRIYLKEKLIWSSNANIYKWALR